MTVSARTKEPAERGSGKIRVALGHGDEEGTFRIAANDERKTKQEQAPSIKAESKGDDRPESSSREEPSRPEVCLSR